MKTLVIHPKDISTDFLCKIYENIECEVLRSRIDLIEANIIDSIKQAERVIFLGHGFPGGMFGFGRVIINSSLVPLLNGMEHNIYIWCHANQFVEKHNLKGFSSSMFISEVGEAFMYDIQATQKEVDNSNNLFSKLLNENLIKTSNTKELVENVKKEYYIENDPIIKYNSERLLHF